MCCFHYSNLEAWGENEYSALARQSQVFFQSFSNSGHSLLFSSHQNVTYGYYCTLFTIYGSLYFPVQWECQLEETICFKVVCSQKYLLDFSSVSFENFSPPNRYQPATCQHIGWIKYLPSYSSPEIPLLVQIFRKESDHSMYVFNLHDSYQVRILSIAVLALMTEQPTVLFYNHKNLRATS